MCTDSVLPSHSLLEIVEMAWGRGSPPSPGREPGAGWRELGAACNVVWGPEKLGGSAGRLSRSADPAVGVGGRRGAPPRWPGRGLSKLERAKTMRPNRRPPQTMAGTVHTGREEGASTGAGGGAWPGRGPRRAPQRGPRPPQNPCPGVQVFCPSLSRRCAGLRFLDVRLGFLFPPPLIL